MNTFKSVCVSFKNKIEEPTRMVRNAIVAREELMPAEDDKLKILGRSNGLVRV